MANEREMTVAVEAAAKNLWDRQRNSLPPSTNKPWEELHPMAKNALRENVLSIVVAALEAVEPVMKHAAWEEGRKVGVDQTAFEEGYPLGYEVGDNTFDNPYPEVL